MCFSPTRLLGVSGWCVCLCRLEIMCVWFGVCLCNDAFLSAFKTFPVFSKQSPLLEVCGRSSVARQIHRVLWLIDSTVQSNSWAQGCELASASWEKLSLIHVWMCPGTVCGYISISKWLSPAPVSCAFTNRKAWRRMEIDPPQCPNQSVTGAFIKVIRHQ